MKFEDRSTDWGFEKAQRFLKAQLMRDLDGGGDLDIVTNNMNEEAGIYRNNSSGKDSSSHYLTIQIKGKSPNTFGIGTKAFVFADGKLQYQELQPERGFMSSSEPLLHFGLADKKIIDSIIINLA